MPRLKKPKPQCTCTHLFDRTACPIHGGKVTVIRDVSDGNFDYYIPSEEAHRLYKEGKLAIDETNKCYCTIK
jgi:hypothetical protein